MKFFNNAGPVNCSDHYCLSPLSRLNLEEMLSLIGNKKYFVMHAPRQTGKTSCLITLMNYLNKSEKYKCLYVNIESAQAARENVHDGIMAILSEISSQSDYLLNDGYIKSIWKTTLEESGAHTALKSLLSLWAKKSDKPVVLLIDEIDSLIGDTLISVLRQLRSGYTNRPASFPQSIILCGIRDVRDYRIHSSEEKTIITGGSAFNVKSESLRLGDFTKEDIKTLYHQHTEDTGQEFSEPVFDLVWELTEGQPWLVNTLAYEACFKMTEFQDRERIITPDVIQQAKENIILRRDSHLDQLVDKLSEPRVRRVIEPLLSGVAEPQKFKTDDVQYVEDLGLIKSKGQIRISNKIYQEIIPRELTFTTQVTISHQPEWYIDKESGKIDMNKLLKAFQEFFREHSEHWIELSDYKEAGPQLLLQAFLQRILNGGGRIEREYGLGLMRTDLIIIWPHKLGTQKIIIELKLLYGSLEKTITNGIKQLWQYLDRTECGEGHLIVFDRTKNRSWKKKIFKRQRSYKKKPITIWGM